MGSPNCRAAPTPPSPRSERLYPMALRGNQGPGLLDTRYRNTRALGDEWEKGRGNAGRIKRPCRPHISSRCLPIKSENIAAFLGASAGRERPSPSDDRARKLCVLRQYFGFTQGWRRAHRSRRHCNTGSMRGVSGASPSSQLPVLKIHLICCPLLGDISDIKLIRTDFFFF